MRSVKSQDWMDANPTLAGRAFARWCCDDCSVLANYLGPLPEGTDQIQARAILASFQDACAKNCRRHRRAS